MYVDFHVLQTVPPSCVNRDDTGTPKTAVYGGVTRARVSSQAWKHAMRQMFREELLEGEAVGTRTKKIVGMVAQQIRAIAPDQDAVAMAQKALENAGLESVDAEKGTGALFFISHAQTRALAELIVEGSEDKKAYKAALKDKPSADMILFGRMVAKPASLSEDAAAQVAHSISTHAVQNEYDYFTAVDDEDNIGAGHLDTTEYNSATLYRYATVNVAELAAHMTGEECGRVLRAFAEAFIRSMPTGKQNSFANRTLPDAVYVTIRNDQPVNLCSAFERAIPATALGYAQASQQRLIEYAMELYENYADSPVKAFAVGRGWGDMAQAMPLPRLLTVLQEVAEKFAKDNEVQ